MNRVEPAEWKLVTDLIEERFGLTFDGVRGEILHSKLQPRLRAQIESFRSRTAHHTAATTKGTRTHPAMAWGMASWKKRYGARINGPTPVIPAPERPNTFPNIRPWLAAANRARSAPENAT